MPVGEFQNPLQLLAHERVHLQAQEAFSICLLHYRSAVSAKRCISKYVTYENSSLNTKEQKTKVFLGNYSRRSKAKCTSSTIRDTDSPLTLWIPMFVLLQCE